MKVLVVVIGLGLMAGACVPRRLLYCLRHPEKCLPGPTPTATATPTPTATATPTPTPDPTPTPTASPAPVVHPTLFKWKVSNHCSNPHDGPRFQVHHICEVDSTQLFFDGEHLNEGGPCDTDHPKNYFSFCNGQDYDDPRGPLVTVTGAESFTKSDENPHKTVVVFIPGQAFQICTRPFDDAQTRLGIRFPVRHPAEHCETHSY